MSITLKKQAPPSSRARQNLVLVAPLLLLAILRLTVFPPAAAALPAWVMGLGTPLIAAGLWLRICARQWKVEHGGGGLVTDGLYGYLRHPLYLGSFMLGLGVAWLLGDGVLLAAYLVCFWISHGSVIRQEDQGLTAVFGETFLRYREAVPALLPRLGQPARPVVPARLREAVVREGDALCIWLALPLVIQLVQWRLHGGSAAPVPGWYPALLLVALGLLAVVWFRLKREWRELITRERARR